MKINAYKVTVGFRDAESQEEDDWIEVSTWDECAWVPREGESIIVTPEENPRWSGYWLVEVVSYAPSRGKKGYGGIVAFVQVSLLRGFAD